MGMILLIILLQNIHGQIVWLSSLKDIEHWHCLTGNNYDIQPLIKYGYNINKEIQDGNLGLKKKKMLYCPLGAKTWVGWLHFKFFF